MDCEVALDAYMLVIRKLHKVELKAQTNKHTKRQHMPPMPINERI